MGGGESSEKEADRHRQSDGAWVRWLCNVLFLTLSLSPSPHPPPPFVNAPLGMEAGPVRNERGPRCLSRPQTHPRRTPRQKHRRLQGPTKSKYKVVAALGRGSLNGELYHRGG
jgi:hypothetical protein